MFGKLLKKIFGGGDKSSSSSSSNQSSGVSNAAMLESMGGQVAASGGEKEEGGWLSRAWGGLKNGVSNLVDGGANLLSDIGSGVGNLVEGGANLLGDIGSGISNGIGTAVDFVKGAASGFGDFDLNGALVGGGSGALTGLLSGGPLGALAGLVGGAAVGGFGNSMLKEGERAIFDGEEDILEATAAIPDHHIVMEQLAHRFAYSSGGESVMRSWGYEQIGELDDQEGGFRCIALAPIDKSSKDQDGNPLESVVAFRGTANMQGWLDDANPAGIGTWQFGRNEGDIGELLSQAAAQGNGRADVTGHSLGGALAQMAAARFGNLVGDIVTFQSPGINAEEASNINPEEHTSTHYRMGGDIVSDAGEAFSEGDVYFFDQFGVDGPAAHIDYPLAMLNTLRQEHGEGGVDNVYGGDVSNLNSVTKTDQDTTRTTGLTSGLGALFGGGRNVAETGRSAIGQLASRDKNRFATAWMEIRGMVQSAGGSADLQQLKAQARLIGENHGVEGAELDRITSQIEPLYRTYQQGAGAGANG